MYIRIFTGLILALSIMISCASSDEKASTQNDSLENTRWVLRSLNGKNIFPPEIGREAFMTLVKRDKQARGNAGCNTFFSSYTISKNQIKFGPVSRTEMFCEQQMETENNFIKALEVTQKYKIKGDKLYLYDSVKQVATFEAIFLN